MASQKTQQQMVAHHRLSQVESASTIVMMAYDPVGPRNKKKIKGSMILSTLDVASGFWTIPVQPEDQHKLAFTFCNRQYTFTRCPFGYANSPAESNIFLDKACPDTRGNLVYVDNVLMKSSNSNNLIMS